MKKSLSLVLVVALAFATLQIGYADTGCTCICKEVHLKMASDEESIEIMGKSGIKELEKTLSSDLESNIAVEKLHAEIKSLSEIVSNSSLTLKIQDIEYVKEGMIISGDGEILISDQKINFLIEKQLLTCENCNQYNKIYTGVLKSSAEIGNRNVPLNVDIFLTSDFENSIASVSLDSLENEGAVMFFGEIFDEYEEYYCSQLKEGEGLLENEGELSEVSMASSSTYKYAYVDTVTNSTLGASSGAETIVMSVMKRDFRDRNSIENGFEMVRVFGRASNALSYVDDATSAYPVEANLTFKCAKHDFLDVIEVTPSGSSEQMPAIFNIVASLHPSVGAAFAVVNLLYSSVGSGTTSSIYAESGFSDQNAASGTVVISGMANMSNVNLPSSVSASNAKTDDEHGITWKVKYGTTGDDTPGNARVTVTASLDYRFYYDTHRTTVKTTGTVSNKHLIYKS